MLILVKSMHDLESVSFQRCSMSCIYLIMAYDDISGKHESVYPETICTAIKIRDVSINISMTTVSNSEGVVSYLALEYTVWLFP